MKEGFVIRFLIVALPAGLLLSGILAILSSHFDKEKTKVDPNELVRLEAAAINRQPVNRVDLANSLEVLNRRIGERHPLLPAKLESAAVWIESTLGPGNIGYLVERQVFDSGDVQVRNLIAELPGRERRDEIIVVGANYDTIPGGIGTNGNGSGVAALIALARAFAGDQQARTIRFVAFANGEPPCSRNEAMGSVVYTKDRRSRDERIVALMNMVLSGKADGAGEVISFVGNEDSRFFVESAVTTFRRAINTSAASDVLQKEELEVRASDHWVFRQSGYPAVMVSGTVDHATAGVDELEAFTQGIKAVIDTWANP